MVFFQHSCSLCMRERIKISKVQQLEENYLINSCHKNFGVCRHKTRFHRFLKEKQSMKSTSTVEGIKPERVDRMDGKGKLIRKSPLGWCTLMILPQEMLTFAHQCQEILYVYDIIFGKLAIAWLLIKLVSLFAVSKMF